MSKRIDKLTAVKERAVDVAERTLINARAATAAAEQAIKATEEQWEQSQEKARHAASIDDLIVIDARSRTLRQAVQRAEAVLATRRREEKTKLDAVAAARMEMRRFELWGDRADALAKATTDRVARVAEDALAARTKGDI